MPRPDPQRNPQPFPQPLSPGMYPPGQPQPPYPSPPPPARPRRKVNGWVLAAVAGVVCMIGWVAVLAIVLNLWSSSYNEAEQAYLAEMHHSHYTWNSDDEDLVHEGHAVCAILDSNGGNQSRLIEYRIVGYGPDPMPAFLRPYGEDQRSALVDAATKHFCDRYTLYVGDTPL